MISDSTEKTATILAMLRNPNWDYLTPAEQRGKVIFEMAYLEDQYKRVRMPEECKN